MFLVQSTSSSSMPVLNLNIENDLPPEPYTFAQEQQIRSYLNMLTSMHGKNLLHLFAAKKHKNMIAFLVKESGHSLYSLNDEGKVACFDALNQDDADLLDFFISLGFSKNFIIDDATEQTILNYAIMQGLDKVTELLESMHAISEKSDDAMPRHPGIAVFEQLSPQIFTAKSLVPNEIKAGDYRALSTLPLKPLPQSHSPSFAVRPILGSAFFQNDQRTQHIAKEIEPRHKNVSRGKENYSETTYDSAVYSV